jgi:hypothetical protein
VTSGTKKILEEALALSQQPVQLSPEWSVEIGDRIRKIERGEAKFLDAEEHLAELRQKHTD